VALKRRGFSVALKEDPYKELLTFPVGPKITNPAALVRRKVQLPVR